MQLDDFSASWVLRLRVPRSSSRTCRWGAAVRMPNMFSEVLLEYQSGKFSRPRLIGALGKGRLSTGPVNISRSENMSNHKRWWKTMIISEQLAIQKPPERASRHICPGVRCILQEQHKATKCNEQQEMLIFDSCFVRNLLASKAVYWYPIPHAHIPWLIPGLSQRARPATQCQHVTVEEQHCTLVHRFFELPCCIKAWSNQTVFYHCLSQF